MTSREFLDDLAISSLDDIARRCQSVVSANRESWKTDVVLAFAPVFFQIELDWRETAVFTLVGRLRDGAPPSGYYLDESGNRVRWHLSAVLSASGVPELLRAAKALKSAQAGSGEQAMEKQITLASGTISRIIDEYVSEVAMTVQRLSAEPAPRSANPDLSSEFQ